MSIAHLDRFWATARERESIRLRREEGLPKDRWTDDPVFKTGRFCNVWGQYDKTSVIIHDILRSAPLELKYPMSLALRLINHPRSLSSWSWDEASRDIRDHLRSVVYRGIHTNAYRINTPLGLNNREGVLLLQDRALQNLTGFSMDGSVRFSELHKTLKEKTGTTDFITFQAALDLRYLGYSGDVIDDWTYIGVGAVRGAKAVLGEPVQAETWKRTAGGAWWSGRTDRNTADLKRAEGIIWEITERPQINGPWSVHETEGWLCEFDKYERLRIKMGIEV